MLPDKFYLIKQIETTHLRPCLHCAWQSTRESHLHCNYRLFCQFHSSVQLVTRAPGWLRLIGGQYVFTLQCRLMELEQPDGIVCASTLVKFFVQRQSYCTNSDAARQLDGAGGWQQMATENKTDKRHLRCRSRKRANKSFSTFLITLSHF